MWKCERIEGYRKKSNLRMFCQEIAILKGKKKKKPYMQEYQEFELSPYAVLFVR